MRTIDLIRIILGGILCLTVFIHTKEKFDEKKKKRKIYERENPNEPKISISVLKIFLVNFFTLKNLLIYFALGFNIVGFIIFSTENYDINSLYKVNPNEYIDLFYFAKKQKFARTLDILSLFFYAIYFTKYLQYIHRVQILLAYNEFEIICLCGKFNFDFTVYVLL